MVSTNVNALGESGKLTSKSEVRVINYPPLGVTSQFPPNSTHFGTLAWTGEMKSGGE